jgi:hypothetical protein
MKRYIKPTLTKRVKLSDVTAMVVASDFEEEDVSAET